MYVVKRKYKDTSYFYLIQSYRENGKIKQKTVKKFKNELPEKYKKYYLPKVETANIEFINTIFHGNSFDLIKQIKNQDLKVDLILTDPPYNIGQEKKLTKKNGQIVTNQKAWGAEYNDNQSELKIKKWFKQLAKDFFDILSDRGSCLIFFDRNKPYLLEPFYKLFDFKNSIVFVKNNPIPQIRKVNYRSSFEQCFWFSKGSDYFLKFVSQKEMKNVFFGNIGNKQSTHPNEKYPWMIEPLIKRHSQKGDIVLDPFAGSGVVAEVCKRYKRKYILCDQRKKYLIEAKNRL